MRNIIALLVFFAVEVAPAAIPARWTLVGVVKKIENEKVLISTDTGALYVPRKAFPKNQELILNTKVRVRVDYKEIVALN